MSTYSNTGDSIVGTFLIGLARKVDPLKNAKFLYPMHNEKQFLLTKKGAESGIRSRCIIKNRCRINIPYHYDRIKIHMENDDEVTGGDIYCECKHGEHTSKIGKRFLKLGEKHAQGCKLESDLGIAVVLKEFMQSRSFTLNKNIGLDDILGSKRETKASE